MAAWLHTVFTVIGIVASGLAVLLAMGAVSDQISALLKNKQLLIAEVARLKKECDEWNNRYDALREEKIAVENALVEANKLLKPYR